MKRQTRKSDAVRRPEQYDPGNLAARRPKPNIGTCSHGSRVDISRVRCNHRLGCAALAIRRIEITTKRLAQIIRICGIKQAGYRRFACIRHCPHPFSMNRYTMYRIAHIFKRGREAYPF